MLIKVVTLTPGSIRAGLFILVWLLIRLDLDLALAFGRIFGDTAPLSSHRRQDCSSWHGLKVESFSFGLQLVDAGLDDGCRNAVS